MKDNKIFCTPDDIKFGYDMSTPNEEVVLYNGPIEFDWADSKYRGEARVFVKWFPKRGTYVHISNLNDIIGGIYNNNNLKVVLLEIGTTIGIYVYSAPITGGSILGKVNGNIEFGSADELVRIKSQILNFHDVWTDMIIDGVKEYGGGLTFSGGGWDVFILGQPDHSKTPEKIKEKGGYFPTHTVHIQKTDKKTFTQDEVKDFIVRLFWFMSFVNGGFTPLFLIEGSDKKGNKWTFWNANWSNSIFKEQSNWFPWYGHGIDKALLDNYLNLTTDDKWYNTIKSAVKYYVMTLRAGDEGRFIWLTLGLEVLAWGHWEIKNPTSESGKEFDAKAKEFDAKALDYRIKFLLEKQGLSHKIPNELPKLKEELKKDRNNGASLLADIRNEIAHPQKKKKYLDKPELLSQSYLLGLWYLELSILYLLDYDGDYKHQLCGGLPSDWTKKVPWAKNNR